MKKILCTLLLTSFILCGVYAQSNSGKSGIPLNTSVTVGSFFFMNGAFGNNEAAAFSSEINLEYQIFDDLSAGLSILGLFNTAIDWYAPGIFLTPLLSVQTGDFNKLSHRMEIGPPMYGQTYFLIGYVLQFYNFLGGIHLYYDWRWQYSALNVSVGYQLSF